MRIIRFALLSVTILCFGFQATALAEYSFNAGDTKVSLYSDIEIENFYKVTNSSTGDDDTDLQFSVASTSRVGLKAAYGDFSTHAEFGFGFPGDIGVYTRLLYGTWKMDMGTLTIGQNYTPYTWGTHEVSDDLNAFSGHGSLFDWRQPMVAFKFNNGFYVNAIKPADWGVTYAADADVDVTLPKLAAGFDHWGDTFSYGLGVAFQTYDEEAPSIGFDDTVNSGFIYLHGLYNLSKSAKISFNTHYGQNLNEFGTYKTSHQAADISTGTIENTTAYGGFIEGSFTLLSNKVLNTGVGYTVGDNDLWASKDDKLGAFINVYIPLNAYITAIPEFSYTDNLDDRAGNDEGDQYYAGMMWRISF